MRSHLTQSHPTQSLPTHWPHQHLTKCELALAIAQLPNIPTTGKALKAVEDKLDSILCAYVAAHWWYWGESRNGVLGDRTSSETKHNKSHIIVLSPPQAPVNLVS